MTLNLDISPLHGVFVGGWVSVFVGSVCKTVSYLTPGASFVNQLRRMGLSSRRGGLSDTLSMFSAISQLNYAVNATESQTAAPSIPSFF